MLHKQESKTDNISAQLFELFTARDISEGTISELCFENNRGWHTGEKQTVPPIYFKTQRETEISQHKGD